MEKEPTPPKAETDAPVINTENWLHQPADFPDFLDPYHSVKRGYASPKERANLLRETYPEKLTHPEQVLYRFVDNESGVQTGTDGVDSYWQTNQPNMSYSGQWLIQTTVGELNALGITVSVDHAAVGNTEASSAVIAISDHPMLYLPGERRESAGWAQDGKSPVYLDEEKSPRYIDGAPIDQAWTDHQNQRHFLDE